MVCRIVMPLTRADRVKIMGKMIRDLDFGKYSKSVLVVCDNKEIEESLIRDSMKGIPLEVIYTGNGVTNSMDLIRRRDRIVNCWNIIREYMERKSDLVLGIEDDGNFKSGDFLKIESTFKDKYINTYCRCGFVSGVEAGRWGYKMIGAWQFENERKDIIRTIPFRDSGIEGVDAAGFYFFLSTSEVIASSNFHTNFFGPDVNFGIDLVEKGYLNFVDHGARIGHDSGLRELLVDRDCVVLEYSKFNENIWRRIESKGVNSIL